MYQFAPWLRGPTSTILRGMRRLPALALALALLAACDGPTPAAPDDGTHDAGDGGWRSTLFPDDWTPAFTDDAGRFLHDFWPSWTSCG